MQVLPHVLDVSVKFTPVHNFIPKKSVTDSPFIFKHDRNGNMREEEKWYKKGAAQTLQEASPQAAEKQAAEDAKEEEERKAREAYFDDDDDWEEIEIEEEDDPEEFDTAAIANNNQEYKDKTKAFQDKQNAPTQIDPIPIKKISTGVSTPPYLQKAVPPKS